MIIAIANQKGGVGKTTSTHNISVALAQKGYKVLMIDLDSQASLTIATGLEPLEMDKNIVSLLEKKGLAANDCIHKLKENLYIIPSIIDLASLEMDMYSRVSKEKVLDRALEEIRKEFDYILIDCPPQLGVLTINGVSCADSVIIPVKTDYLSYRGLVQLIDTVEEVKELINPNLEIMGVLATLYDSRNNHDNEILTHLKKEYNVIETIKNRTAAKKGLYEGKAVVEIEPEADLSQAYVNVATYIVDRKAGK